MLRSPAVSARTGRSVIVVGLAAVGGILIVTAMLATPALAEESAAAGASVRRGDIRGTVRSGALARSYLLHVPPGYDPDAPWPLVLALHGGGGQGRGMAWLTGLSRLADRRSFLVAYPDGVERSWNDGREDPGVPASRWQVDDVAFLVALIDQVASAYRIDATRVYATGISNGGFMSQRLACEASTRVTAIASVVATIGVELAGRCSPARAVPVLMVNGTADPLVPYDGGQIRLPGGRLRPGRIASVADTVALWAGHNGCSRPPEVTREPDRDPSDGVTVRRETQTGCLEGSEVTLYVMEGGGHVWPGGPQYLPSQVIGRTTGDIDSQVIWGFFSRHRLP